MEIKIGNTPVGNGHPTFVVAEMSGNHGGDLGRALEIIRAAKRAGADAVKLQTYTPDTITLKSSNDDFRIQSISPWSEYSTLWDLYNEAHTPWEWHEQIFEEAAKVGIEIFSSPFDSSAVDFLTELNVPAFKIASPEITDLRLLEKVGRTLKPVLISTGLASLEDLELGIKTLRDSGNTKIVLLKCTTAYPAPLEEANLRTLQDMSSRFGVITGLSDHTLGSTTAIVSVALGAAVIEKHFVLDDSIETVDSFFSLGESAFSKMVQDIRSAEKVLGQVDYQITDSARPSLSGRRSLYVAADIQIGEVFTTDNIRSVRPSFGIHPKFLNQIIGRRATKNLNYGDRLEWGSVE